MQSKGNGKGAGKQTMPATQRGGEEVAQSQALPNLEKQRLHNNKSSIPNKQRNLKKSHPPNP